MSIVLLILKIILYIILAVLGLIFIILLLPVSAEGGFVDKKLTYKLRYWFIDLYDSDGKGLIPWLKKLKDKRRKPAEKPPEDDFQLPDIDDIPEPEEVDELPAAVEDTNPEPEPINEDATAEEITGKTAAETAEDIPDTEPIGEKKEPDEEKKSGRSLGDKIDMILDIWEIADRPLLKIFKSFKFSEVYLDLLIANEDAYKCALNYGRISGTFYNLLGWLGALCTVKYKTVDINPGFSQKESRWDASARLSFRLIDMVIAGLWFLITYIIKIYLPNKLKQRKLNAARQK